MIIDPSSLLGLSNIHKVFGTPDNISPIPNNKYLILARIQYSPSKEYGILLIIKPRRLNNLPVDVAGYSDRDRAFPQQTTGDQFFDEAQWESYSELGLISGSIISNDFIENIMSLDLETLKVIETKSLISEKVKDSKKNSSNTNINNRRERFSKVLGQSLGFGAVFSVTIVLWQAFEHHQKENQEAIDSQKKSISDFQTNIKRSLSVPIAKKSNEYLSLLNIMNLMEDFLLIHGSDYKNSIITLVKNNYFQHCIQAQLVSTDSNYIRPTYCLIPMAIMSGNDKWDKIIFMYQKNSFMQLNPLQINDCDGVEIIPLPTS